MPTWLAIAIPSVIAVAALLMWTLEYSKKAHEIAKLRLELEKLKREAVSSVREEQTKASGLYKPTAAEVDSITGDATSVVVGKLIKGSGANAGDDYHDGANGPTLETLVTCGLVVVFGLYVVVHLALDVIHLIMWVLRSFGLI
jgi:hypothetical protein